MRTFKHAISIVFLILLLKVVGVILDSVSPGTRDFHTQLLHVTQLVIFSGLLVSILLMAFRIKLSFFRTLLLWVVFIMICDLICFAMLNRPRVIPLYAKKAFRDFYNSTVRNIIQYDPVSTYDSGSFYNFLPDTAFNFRNIEFNNIVSTNSRGFRDNEASMKSPEIICVGDSYALGWGVNQNESFPELIESITGKKVLNCGMSSFGTAREMSRLFTCDLSQLKYLIIQYCKNDVGENFSFAKNGDSLHIGSRKKFEAARSGYNWLKMYYPGKYMVNISINLAREKVRNALGLRNKKYYLSEDPKKCAEYFLRVVNHYQMRLVNVQVIVFDINPYQDLNGSFIRAVDSLLIQTSNSEPRKNLRTIDVSAMFTPRDYYDLDVHLTPAGHQKLAKKIIQYINDQTSP